MHALAASTLDDTQKLASRRHTGLDFWRGVVLCTIFVNHVPGNPFERLTMRNFGFSDSSEAFVFISGVSLSLAYRHRFSSHHRPAVIRSLGRRAAKLYTAHILISLVGLAIFALGALVFDEAGLMAEHGRDLALDHPGEALGGLLSLGHQFGYFNILPLYVLLVAAIPALLWLDGFGTPLMLGCSLLLYGATRVFDINIPTWPMRGVWFFDPFAWQLLLSIGLAVGARGRAWTPPHGGLLAISACVVLAALVCTTNGFGWWPGLYDAARDWADLDKTMLGTGRLLHFLALSYCIAGLGVARMLSTTPVFAPFALIGRHGLAVFLALSILAAVGQVVTRGLGHSWPLDGAVVGGGLLLLYALAAALDAPRLPEVTVAATATSRRR